MMAQILVIEFEQSDNYLKLTILETYEVILYMAKTILVTWFSVEKKRKKRLGITHVF